VLQHYVCGGAQSGAPVSSAAHLNIFPRDANDPEDTQRLSYALPASAPTTPLPQRRAAGAPLAPRKPRPFASLRLHMRVVIQASHRRPPTSVGGPPPCIAAERFLKAQAQVKPDTVSPADRTIRASKPSLLDGALRGSGKRVVSQSHRVRES
jgi:hypothetical protein